MPPATDEAQQSPLERLAEAWDHDPSVLERFSDAELAVFLTDWRVRARPKQLPPDGDWRTWVIRTGRGWGKDWTGSHWVYERAMEAERLIALIAATPADARDFMIEGPSGIATLHEDVEYEPSNRRLIFPSGSRATVFSSEKPGQLRGFSGDTAWIDEFAKFRNPREVWEQLQMGLREVSEDRPRVLITTTPRPLRILGEIEAIESTHVTVGHSRENAANLDPSWFDEVADRYDGTRLGRQELAGEILQDIEGAIVPRAAIEDLRVTDGGVPDLQRVVVAVDPAVTSTAHSDETGIIVAGKGVDGHGYVLADRSGRLAPEAWAERVVDAYHRHEADRIVAEVNNGGDLVQQMIRLVDASASYKEVRASRGKAVRAEPALALYERGEVHHARVLEALEDQVTAFSPQGYQGESSPDRADALVYALTELFALSGKHKKRLWSRSGAKARRRRR